MLFMNMKRELPVFSLEIVDDMSSDVEVDMVSLVDRPAIDKAFLMFRDKMAFEVQDEEQHIISGPLMLSETPIYRSDSNGEYYVVFSADTIKQIAQKFFKKGYQANVNLMHDSGKVLEGLTMFESWITDEKRGILPMKGFSDVPDGSWFGSFKVDNAEVWQMIKEGQVKGFSVEGVFNYRKTGLKEMQMWEQIVEILEQVK